MNTIVDKASAGQYSEFADIMKGELKRQLANHDTIKNYTHLVQQIHDRKEIFKSVRN